MQIAHVEHPVEAIQQVMIVCHHDECRVVALNLLQQDIQHLVLVVRIQVTRGLIGQDQLGARNQCAADRCALPLSLGQLLRVTVDMMHRFRYRQPVARPASNYFGR